MLLALINIKIVEHIPMYVQLSKISKSVCSKRCSIDTSLNCNVVHDIDDVGENKQMVIIIDTDTLLLIITLGWCW